MTITPPQRYVTQVPQPQRRHTDAGYIAPAQPAPRSRVSGPAPMQAPVEAARAAITRVSGMPPHHRRGDHRVPIGDWDRVRRGLDTGHED